LCSVDEFANADDVSRSPLMSNAIFRIQSLNTYDWIGDKAFGLYQPVAEGIDRLDVVVV
jgi:hypothetical protein